MESAVAWLSDGGGGEFRPVGKPARNSDRVHARVCVTLACYQVYAPPSPPSRVGAWIVLLRDRSTMVRCGGVPSVTELGQDCCVRPGSSIVHTGGFSPARAGRGNCAQSTPRCCGAEDSQGIVALEHPTWSSLLTQCRGCFQMNVLNARLLLMSQFSVGQPHL